MSGTLEAEAEQISSESGVPVDIHLSEGRGFDGVSTAFAIITVVAGGIGGGILTAVGEEVWSRIKRLVSKTKEADYQCTLVVVHKTGDTEFRFRCAVDGPEDVERVVRALQDGDAPPAPHNAAGEPVVLRLDDDGTWKPAG
ncbi:hypothetical protein [Actinomadura sp. 21ATH]|uniref:hypothetical protein n=1 Tax=Actinomadura sp. 21ATH TaxID=1735444 RepID=UPI0035C19520